MPFCPDYKYFELVRPRKHARRDRLLKVHPCLKQVAHAFFTNVARTDSFCWFPAHVSSTALPHQLWRDYAVLKVKGKLNLSKATYEDDTEKAIFEEIQKLKRAHAMAGKDDSAKRRLKVGVPYINELLSRE